ncbi:carboxypeptidase [Colletotrichum graminicola]|uniref:Carboxypeptidase n=1 Tax=Colletotrichum graminicola (strain M1.001 / M2 / FGSC 10212) TaxID=645133 RepID=E3Q268_COLGM|nr:carboxypeptidase [Colletotrichum graminicola M1.001]EFQ25169.1 carboxypeptidase [Colletotrichum graminicola M1.001]WDK15209.1 carboxypeptidase [Colletotrichum graminicola]
MVTTSRLGLLGLCLLASAQAAKYGYNNVQVRKDSEIVAANFKDVEDVELLSPAFLTPETIPEGFLDGTKGPTDDDLLDTFVQGLADKNEWMTYNKANFTSEEGRPFPYLYLSSTKLSRRASSSTSKVRVWIQGAVHGNEPAGDQSLLALLGALDANQTWAASLFEKLDIVILPRYNPDGVFYFQRTLATNYDPNRDHVKLARKQTRDIKTLFGKFNPHVAVDMHEYSAPTRFGDYRHAADGLFSAAKNLNIHPDIRALSEELFAKNIGSAMESRGLRWEPYVTGGSSADPAFKPTFAEAGSDAKIGRNAMGLTQCVTFLIEMRGIYLADQEFQRRTVAGLTMATSVLQTAADNAEKVYTTVESSIADFKSSDSEIIVTDSSAVIQRTFTMVNANNGSITQVPINFLSTTPVKANMTRARPAAYLIPAAWADLVERLRVSGLEAQTLIEPYKGTVEAYSIESAVLETGYYEGVVRADVTTSTLTKEVNLPAGSFLVSTKQKNAALAFVALEPENIDSYASFNIVPVKEGDEYPIYRVLT